MKPKKDKQGISLIVLVITIIVMIILAAAIVLTLNNSGIINRANEAVEKSDLAQVKHIAALKWAEAYLDETIEGEEAYKSYIEDGLRESKINPDDYEITVTAQGVEVALKVKIPSEWKENITAIVDTVPIPKGFVASPYEGEKTKAGGLVIYELAEGETAIPAEETQYTSLTTRNQYVWVPVAKKDFTTKFVRQGFGMTENDEEMQISNVLGTEYWEAALDSANMPLLDQTLSFMTSNTLAEVQAMYASVKEYEGFYIARYEAGLDSRRNGAGTAENLPNGKSVYSRMNKIAYTSVPWTWNGVINEDTNGAVEVARSIYPNTADNTTGVISTLTYGVQWDATLKWWLDVRAVEYVANSADYGNYSNHRIESADELNEGALVRHETRGDSSFIAKEDMKDYPKLESYDWELSTGALKKAKVNNIYDMAGNLHEWTMEGYSSDKRVFRGGGYSDQSLSSFVSVAYRHGTEAANAFGNVSFRPCLYIKK